MLLLLPPQNSCFGQDCNKSDSLLKEASNARPWIAPNIEVEVTIEDTGISLSSWHETIFLFLAIPSPYLQIIQPFGGIIMSSWPLHPAAPAFIRGMFTFEDIAESITLVLRLSTQETIALLRENTSFIV